jgi:hypothetical protein
LGHNMKRKRNRGKIEKKKKDGRSRKITIKRVE